MSKEIREQIDRVRNFKNTLNESFKEKLSFLEGKPISLVRTFRTVGKWDSEKGEMEQIVKHEDFDGFIGDIGEYDGRNTPGFWFLNEDGKRIGFVFYDKYTDGGAFIDGDSSYSYQFSGKTKKDDRILQLFVDNLE